MKPKRLKHLCLWLFVLAPTAISLTCNSNSSDQPKKKRREGRRPDVIFLATPQDVVEKMFELAKINEQDVVYDLGSGDGRIVIMAAKKFGCRGVGYEIDPELLRKSQENARQSGVDSLVRFEERDVFTVDLSEASVVTLYMTLDVNERLIPQLEKLKAGSRIVAHDFGIPGYKPDETVRMESSEDENRHTIYFWTTPLKRESEE